MQQERQWRFSLEFVKNLFNCSLPIVFQAGKEVNEWACQIEEKQTPLTDLTFLLFLFLSIADTICDSYQALRQCAEVDGVHPVLQILPGTSSIQSIKQLLLFKDTTTVYRTEKQQLHSSCTIAMIVQLQLISIICSSQHDGSAPSGKFKVETSTIQKDSSCLHCIIDMTVIATHMNHMLAPGQPSGKFKPARVKI